MKPSSPNHLLLRFSDTRLKLGQIISANQEVIEREGSIWFGNKQLVASLTMLIHETLFKSSPGHFLLKEGNYRL
jgi:hypothetical protein